MWEKARSRVVKRDMGRCGSESLTRKRGGHPLHPAMAPLTPVQGRIDTPGRRPVGQAPVVLVDACHVVPAHRRGDDAADVLANHVERREGPRGVHSCGKSGPDSGKDMDGIESSGRMVAFLPRTLCHVPYCPCRTWDGSVMRRTSIPGSRRRRKTSFTSWPAEEAAHFNFCEKSTCDVREKGPCGGAGDMQRPPTRAPGSFVQG